MEQNLSGARTNLSQTPSVKRRYWSLSEETVLVCTLKDLVVRGYKCDNSFKTGYLLVLEQAMCQAFPGTDLKSEPHISSKIHVWKKIHASIAQMLGTSGFGWNDSSNTIEIQSEQVWQEYIKVNYVLYIAYVPLLRWQQCKWIKNSSRKRKSTYDSDDAFVELMKAFCDKTDSHLGEIAKRIGFEHDESNARKVVFEALGNMNNLGEEDKISVSKCFVSDIKHIDLFFSLPDGSKATMVKMIMERRY
ncbi:hypothetical protein BUALT_Bualt04G0015100 [Buddleja alternifolia]|uniref:Myb/SANT-like domain-containing protein n=1 Tax=Buddleja alternifolia TaxID=168488 RepID=A0AAV6XKB3_9LAMI|nr:hypothetical protein BUALT_Bualt04G0015100 [Buddleja alternifolia]